MNWKEYNKDEITTTINGYMYFWNKKHKVLSKTTMTFKIVFEKEFNCIEDAEKAI